MAPPLRDFVVLAYPFDLGAVVTRTPEASGSPCNPPSLPRRLEGLYRALHLGASGACAQLWQRGRGVAQEEPQLLAPSPLESWCGKITTPGVHAMRGGLG